MLTSVKSHRARNTVTMLKRETQAPDFIPRDVATQFAGFESGGLQRLGYPSKGDSDDIEIRVADGSRSLKVTPMDSSCVISY